MKYSLSEKALDENHLLFLTVKDKNELLDDTTIGSISFPLSDYVSMITKKTQTFRTPEPSSAPFDIVDKENRVQGKISLVFDVVCSNSRGHRIRKKMS